MLPPPCKNLFSVSELKILCTQYGINKIEVSDSKGVVIWGGFSTDWTIKNITIPSSQTSIVYNSDGLATVSLEAGKVYRWRIYASKDAGGGATWNLISSSEDQMGLIKVIQ